MTSTHGAGPFNPMRALPRRRHALLSSFDGNGSRRSISAGAFFRAIAVVLGAGAPCLAPAAIAASVTVKADRGTDRPCRVIGKQIEAAVERGARYFDTVEAQSGDHVVEVPDWQSLAPAAHMDIVKRIVVWHEAFGGVVRQGEIHSERLDRLLANSRSATDPQVLEEVWSEVGTQFEAMISAGTFRLESTLWPIENGRTLRIYRYTMFLNGDVRPSYRYITRAEEIGYPDARLWNLYVDETDNVSAWKRVRAASISALLRIDGDAYFALMRGTGVLLRDAAFRPAGRNAIQVSIGWPRCSAYTDAFGVEK